MDYLQKLEEELYVATIRRLAVPNLAEEILRTAKRNGVNDAQIMSIEQSVRDRTQYLGFVPRKIDSLPPPPESTSGDPKVYPWLQLHSLLSEQGRIRFHLGQIQENASSSPKEIGIREYFGSSEEGLLAASERDRLLSTQLRGSAHFLEVLAPVSLNGKIYLTTRSLHGKLLSEEIRTTGKLKVALAMKVACQILKALDELHVNNLVYRGLGPNRIFIDEGHITLLDWGIPMSEKATPLYALPSESPYRPPEQYIAGGRAGDFYAFGILLVHILTGSPDKRGISSIRKGRVRKVVRKCIQPKPADRFQDAASLRQKLCRKRRWPPIVIAILLPVACVFAGYRWYASRFDTMFVIGSKINVRYLDNWESKMAEQVSYGAEIQVDQVSNGFARFEFQGTKRYLPAKYVVDQQTFEEIDAIYGNPLARQRLVASFQQLALWKYFKDNAMMGNLSVEQRAKYLEDTKDREIWQYFGRPAEEVLQSILISDFHFDNPKRTKGMAILIQKLLSAPQQRRLLLFSFDQDDQAKLEFEFDITSYPGYFMRLVKGPSGLTDFDRPYRQSISQENPAILFENPESDRRHLVLNFAGNYQWIQSTRSYGGNSSRPIHNSSYQAFQEQFERIKVDIRMYHLTLNPTKKEQLLREIPDLIQRYGNVMRRSDHSYLLRSLTRIK